MEPQIIKVCWMTRDMDVGLQTYSAKEIAKEDFLDRGELAFGG